jgi:hypothetical protein
MTARGRAEDDARAGGFAQHIVGSAIGVGRRSNNAMPALLDSSGEYGVVMTTSTSWMPCHDSASGARARNSWRLAGMTDTITIFLGTKPVLLWQSSTFTIAPSISWPTGGIERCWGSIIRVARFAVLRSAREFRRCDHRRQAPAVCEAIDHAHRPLHDGQVRLPKSCRHACQSSRRWSAVASAGDWRDPSACRIPAIPECSAVRGQAGAAARPVNLSDRSGSSQTC